jgi:hypothetical protein
MIILFGCTGRLHRLDDPPGKGHDEKRGDAAHGQGQASYERRARQRLQDLQDLALHRRGALLALAWGRGLNGIALRTLQART